MLDKSYKFYELSGSTLLAASLNDIYSFNIEGCAPMPTQMHSTSMAPTTCYLIKITTVHDAYPSETSWKLHRIGANGDDSGVKSYEKLTMVILRMQNPCACKKESMNSSSSCMIVGVIESAVMRGEYNDITMLHQMVH